ncbi:MAG: hypothetical protein QM751_15390 [Paludibacteraceae bacterium]
MNKIKLLTLVFLLVGTISAFSQISVTSYSTNAFGVSTSKNYELSGEFKSFFNKGIYDDMTFELSGMYNFKPGIYHRFSIGVGMCCGLGAGLISSVTIPVQLEITPLKDFKRLSVVFELAPEFSGDMGMRQLWGLRYTF